jgi:PAS domain S-box-containing protein
LTRLAIAHADPAKIEFAREISRRWPTRLDAPGGIGHVLRTGRPELAHEIPDALLAAHIADPEHLAMLRRLGIVSSMSVALTLRDAPIGVISFVSGESGRRFGRADLAVAEELARRASVAIEHARAFELAEAAERRFRSLVTATTQIVWTTAANGATLDDSPTWRAFTGQTREQWHSGGLIDAIHPSDRAHTRALSAAARANATVMKIECRVRRHDGVYRDMIARGVPVLNDDGSVREWVGTTTDITEAKQSERSLRFLAEASRLMASSLDTEQTLAHVANLAVPALADWISVYLDQPDGTVRLAAVKHVDANMAALLRSMFDRYGLAPGAPGGHASILETGQPQLIPVVTDAIRARVARDAEQRAMLDELGAVSAVMVPIIGSGRTLGTIALVASTSERQYTQDDLALAEELARRVAVALDHARLFELAQRERDRAEEANRAKDLFLSTLSHELRTPLNAIVGWTRMLQTGAISPEKREKALATIDRNARTQVALVEDILDLSRIVTGKMRLEVVPVDVSQVVESAIETVRPAADAKGVRVQVALQDEAEPVMADPNRLQQVVWNLLSNAIKFTPEGGRVNVQLRRVDSSIEITVADTGQGIDPGFLPHVWERFKQADSTTTRAHGGLGLGLAIVKHLVEMHGGSVVAESDGLDLGASFRIRIPVAPMRPSVTTDRPAAQSPRWTTDFPCPRELDGLRVLVVDDEEDSRDLVAGVLEHCKASVTAVASAAAAVNALGTGRYDVLVSDIGMPGEDGLSLIRRVRALPATAGGRIPAVALTAYASLEDRTRAMLAGFNNHVGKPVDLQELLVVIANLAARLAGSGEPE